MKRRKNGKNNNGNEEEKTELTEAEEKQTEITEAEEKPIERRLISNIYLQISCIIHKSSRKIPAGVNLRRFDALQHLFHCVVVN